MNYHGIPLYVSPVVPEGGIVQMGMDIGVEGGKMTLLVGPVTYFTIVHGRPPLWSNNTLGAREAQRYKRRSR